MKPWHSLEGKTIWVTGGAGYLGSAITTELDAQCAKVICFDLPGRADALVREHNLTRTVPLSIDINDAAAMPSMVQQTVEAHGLPDGVVHLVTASSAGKRLEQLSADEFLRTFDLALTPTSKNSLQVSDRLLDIVKAGVRIMVDYVYHALRKHRNGR